jgi:hypothetical protein
VFDCITDIEFRLIVSPARIATIVQGKEILSAAARMGKGVLESDTYKYLGLFHVLFQSRNQVFNSCNIRFLLYGKGGLHRAKAI